MPLNYLMCVLFIFICHNSHDKRPEMVYLRPQQVWADQPAKC